MIGLLYQRQKPKMPQIQRTKQKRRDKSERRRSEVDVESRLERFIGARTRRFTRPQGAFRLETFEFYWILRALRGRRLICCENPLRSNGRSYFQKDHLEGRSRGVGIACADGRLASATIHTSPKWTAT